MSTSGAPWPSAAVLRTFGAAGRRPERLPGGRGSTWRAGAVVLRPHGDPREARWRSDVLARLEHTVGFRTPRPVPTLDGGWTADGWEAWTWCAGETAPERVEDVIRAGAAFHRAVAGLRRPAFLDTVDDAWSRADRAVWGTGSMPSGPTLDRLTAAFRPVRSPSQLVHRDLLGNVLFEPGEPPVVFDWAPSWRPVGYAAAIAAVDAVCWQGVEVERLAALGVVADEPEWSQVLVRALAFRVLTLQLLGTWGPDQARHHGPVVDALLSGAAGTLDA
ncbi:hypothetical protein DEJ23_09655 [Curtobacterium sp. MCSS17_008]|uniref:hypothetical protein n=1 Tax=Curtobacterium sp. MCSS17_008 TaxID=2175647 RepID=UPI000DA7C2F7|nr:hypothetical protein [Curtobacterium sp. MCSS17_008]PZF56434.1 hypothetical protein DEJ23_09655 [Curtobacterium sp. MCSS17_008]